MLDGKRACSATHQHNMVWFSLGSLFLIPSDRTGDSRPKCDTNHVFLGEPVSSTCPLIGACIVSPRNPPHHERNVTGVPTLSIFHLLCTSAFPRQSSSVWGRGCWEQKAGVSGEGLMILPRSLRRGCEWGLILGRLHWVRAAAQVSRQEGYFMPQDSVP